MKTSKLQQASLFDRIKQQKLLLLMLLPGLVLTFIFRYIPMYGVLIAFKDYNPLKGCLVVSGLGLKSLPSFSRLQISAPYLPTP